MPLCDVCVAYKRIGWGKKLDFFPLKFCLSSLTSAYVQNSFCFVHLTKFQFQRSIRKVLGKLYKRSWNIAAWQGRTLTSLHMFVRYRRSNTYSVLTFPKKKKRTKTDLCDRNTVKITFMSKHCCKAISIQNYKELHLFAVYGLTFRRWQCMEIVPTN